MKNNITGNITLHLKYFLTLNFKFEYFFNSLPPLSSPGDRKVWEEANYWDLLRRLFLFFVEIFAKILHGILIFFSGTCHVSWLQNNYYINSCRFPINGILRYFNIFGKIKSGDGKNQWLYRGYKWGVVLCYVDFFENFWPILKD